MHINWKKFASIVKAAAPVVAALVPGGAAIAGPLVAGVAEAEALAGATGPEKKQHVLGIVEQAIVAVNGKAGKEVLDPATTLAAASSAIETTVGIVHLVHNNHPGETVPNPDGAPKVTAPAASAGA